MSGEFSVDLELPDGALRVTWDQAALERLASDAAEPVEPRVEPAPDWSRYECVRLFAAGLADGTVLGVAMARPAGAPHGLEQVAAKLSAHESEAQEMARALISSERDAHDHVSRIGIELFRTEEAVPLRVAADALDEPALSAAEGGRLMTTPMSVRLEGNVGIGLFCELTEAPPA